MENIKLFYPNIYKKEWLKALDKVFDTRWIGQGPLVDEFETKFGDKFNYDYCLAVNSGSAALNLAYDLIGIGKKDEVLSSVLTCTATNLPLVHRGAKIKFLDVNYKLLANYEDIAKKITRKTKAIVVVNLGGLQVDERIFKLAKEKKIPVVVDACQSLGISEKYGDYICYSFQAIKHFTTGDGGMLVIRDKDEYQKAKKLRWFGIDREAKKRANWNCAVNHQVAMEIEELGYKYHMNDISAAIGLVGLKHSDEILKHREKLCNAYIKGLPQLKVVCGGAYWLVALLTDKRDAILDYLQARGIECDLVQLRNDIFKVFGGKKQDLPNMNRLENEYLYLPLTPIMTLKDVNHIVRSIIECLEQLSSLE